MTMSLSNLLAVAVTVALVSLACCDASIRLGWRMAAEHLDDLDLTDDLYHRTNAGLFLPDREPLVFDWVQDQALVWTVSAGHVKLLRDPGYRQFPVYMDWSAIASHHTVRFSSGGWPARLFREK